MQWKEPPGLKAESTCPCSFTDQEKTQTRVNHWTFLSASGTTGWTIWPLATGPLSLATSQLGGQAKVLINEMKMGSLQTASGDALIWTIQKDTLNRCSCLPLCPSSFILESLQDSGEEREKGSKYFLAHSTLKGLPPDFLLCGTNKPLFHQFKSKCLFLTRERVCLIFIKFIGGHWLIKLYRSQKYNSIIYIL